MAQLKCIKGLVMQTSNYEAFITGNIYELFEDTLGDYTVGELEYKFDEAGNLIPDNSKHYIPEPFKSEYFEAFEGV